MGRSPRRDEKNLVQVQQQAQEKGRSRSRSRSCHSDRNATQRQRRQVGCWLVSVPLAEDECVRSASRSAGPRRKYCLFVGLVFLAC